MPSSAKLRVIALGTATTRKRLNAFANAGDFEMISFSSIADLGACLHLESFDVILVDSLHPEASRACNTLLQNSRIPVALLVREKETNWQQLSNWEVDGFISDESGMIEMVARIKALARRKRRVPASRG
jgi:DNA-binding response OmpR family regulator